MPKLRVKVVREYAPGKWVSAECAECCHWKPEVPKRENAERGECTILEQDTDCLFACAEYSKAKGVKP